MKLKHLKYWLCFHIYILCLQYMNWLDGESHKWEGYEGWLEEYVTKSRLGE